MPLYSNAERVIREYLVKASIGEKAKPVTIGELSRRQLEELNSAREKHSLPPVNGRVLFRGKHVYESRVLRDGYSIEDVVIQIKSAFRDDSIVRFTPKMTALQSIAARDDGYGNRVKDECALECTGRYPTSELFSVIPKGDSIKPPKTRNNESRPKAALVNG